MRLYLLKVIICVYFTFNLISFSLAQELNLPRLSDRAEFSLITCSPGNEVYNIFGHSAVRLKDPENNLDFVYNFGTFNFETPGFIMKFVQRRLLYSLSKSHYIPFESVYIAENRGVTEQRLVLNDQQKQKLFLALEKNYLPQNREYLYDFFYDNCATRIRDILIHAIGKTYTPKVNGEKKFRDYLEEYIKHDKWLNFGIDLILGMEADKICSYSNQMFLPDYMSTNLSTVKLEDKLLLEAPKQLLPKPQVKKANISFTDPIFIFSIFSILSIFVSLSTKNRKLVYLWFGLLLFMLSLAGIFLTFMWFGTDHIATKSNLNILWANPLYFFWVLLGSLGYIVKNRPLKTIHKLQNIMCLVLLLSNVSSLLIYFLDIQSYNFAVLPFILMLIFHFGLKVFRKTYLKYS